VDGDWDSPDLSRLLHLLALNEPLYDRHRAGRALVRLLSRLRHVLRANTRRGSRHNVVAHYDLGNAGLGAKDARGASRGPA
jgi:cyclopropane-fatty-acyl-phospholipid synthase